jgi:hypothetical protein
VISPSSIERYRAAGGDARLGGACASFTDDEIMARRLEPRPGGNRDSDGEGNGTTITILKS